MTDIQRADLGGLEDVRWDFHDSRTKSLTHGLHPYPAKYIPQIPSAVIRELSQPGEVVADVFCGSGTTLVEAMALGRNAIGVDANPLACLISEVKTSRLDGESIRFLEGIGRRARGMADTISVQGEGLFADVEPFHSSAPRPDDDAITFWSICR